MSSTNYGTIKNAKPAEITYGLKAVENFESALEISKNGGEETDITLSEGVATFNGTSSEIEYNFGSALPEITIMAWVKWESSNSLKTVFSFGDTGDLFVLGTGIQSGTGTDNDINFGMFYSGWKVASSGITPTLGQWYHICGVMDGTDIKIYVDGVLEGTTAGVGNNYNSYTSIKLGSRHDAANPNWLEGYVEKVKVFDRALEINDIENYYNETMWNYNDNLVVALPFRLENHDPTNVRTLDKSGNENHTTFGDGITPATYPAKLTDRHGYNLDGSDDYFDLPSVTGNYPYMLIEDSSEAFHFSESSTDYSNISTGGSFSGNVYEIMLYSAELSNIQKKDLEFKMKQGINTK